jgi:hypothetical protein
MTPAPQQLPAQEPPIHEPTRGQLNLEAPPIVPASSRPAISREEVAPSPPSPQLRSQRIAHTENIEPTPALKPLPIPLAPAPLPKIPAGEWAPDQSEPHTIRVTIGRVEVKAVMPPALPKSAPPPKRELSLDDYLKQRKAGQR